MIFSNRLRDTRKMKGISQQQLADQLGVSRQTLSKWETGVAMPDAENLIALAEVLDVTTDYLLAREERNERNTRKSSYWVLFEKYDNKLEFLGYLFATFVLVIAIVGICISYSQKADVFIRPGASGEPIGTYDITNELG